MKMKKLLCLMLALVVMVGAVACGAKKATPEEAVKVFINTAVYQQESDIKKFKDIFNQDASAVSKDAEQGFLSGFAAAGSGMDVDDKTLLEIWNNLLTQLKDKTTYTVEVTKDDKKNPELLVKIKGLNMNSMTADMQDKLKKELEKDPTVVQDKEKYTKLVFDVMKESIKTIEGSEKEVSVPVKLEPNKNAKNKWQVVNEMSTVNQLGTAFLSGQ